MKSADVLIVGAGIMGVSTAYHLARRRAGRVVVVERDDVCAGSTALASGGIRHQYAKRIGVELTCRVIETFERFEAEFGVDPRFRQHGYLILVTTDAERVQAEKNVALQKSFDLRQSGAPVDRGERMRETIDLHHRNIVIAQQRDHSRHETGHQQRDIAACHVCRTHRVREGFQTGAQSLQRTPVLAFIPHDDNVISQFR